MSIKQVNRGVIALIICLFLGLLSSPLYAAKLTSGRQDVASAGTPEALGSSQTCDLIYVTAAEGNAGVAVIGESDVVASSGTRTGITLFPGQTIAFPHSNVASIYADVATSGDDVEWLCIDK